MAPSRAGTANFKLCLELPIPWDAFLEHHEKVVLKDFLCKAGCDATFKNLGCLCPTYAWSSHCHCDDENTLQCIAARKYVQNLMNEVINGCRFNERYEWYREIVNTGYGESILYVGSYIVRGKHYVIYKAKVDEDSVRAAVERYGGQVLKCSLGTFICHTCGSCELDSPDGKVQSCAYRSRAYLRSLTRFCHPDGSLDIPSVKEAVRIVKLTRFFNHKRCTPAFNYFHL